MKIFKNSFLILIFLIAHAFSALAFARTVYLTDLEGRIEPLLQLVENKTLVLSNNGFYEFSDDQTKLVFGGDLMDRGPYSLRLLRIFISLKQRYPNRVTLLWGNRDLNKLSFFVEREEKMSNLQDPKYRDFLGEKINLEVAKKGFTLQSLNTPENQIEWWASQYGLSSVIEFHRQELEALTKNKISLREAAKDFADLISNPSREYFSYIKLGQLVYSEESTVYVHGSLPAQNGFVPESSTIFDRYSDWELATNQWGQIQLNNYLEGLKKGRVNLLGKKILYYGDAMYDLGLKKIVSHNNSVIYGTRFKEGDNFRLPPESTIKWLTENSKTMLVLGHSPVGNVPLVLRSKDFLLVMGDTSYSEKGLNSRITIDGDSVQVSAKLENGHSIAYRTSVNDRVSPIGLMLGQDLIIGLNSENRAVLFRYEGRTKIESVADLEGLSVSELAEPRILNNSVIENQKRDLFESLSKRNIIEMDVEAFSSKFLTHRIPILFSGSSSYADSSQEILVRDMIERSLTQLDPTKVIIITGGTDTGFEKIVHEVAAQNGFYIHSLIVSAAKPDSISDKINSFSWVGDNWSDQPRAGMDLVQIYKGYGIILGGGGLLQKALEYGKSIGARVLVAAGVRHGNGSVSASMNFAEQMQESAFTDGNSLLSKIQSHFGFTLKKTSLATHPSYECSRFFSL